MLYLSGFELYSRWVPLIYFEWRDTENQQFFLLSKDGKLKIIIIGKKQLSESVLS